MIPVQRPGVVARAPVLRCNGFAQGMSARTVHQGWWLPNDIAPGPAVPDRPLRFQPSLCAQAVDLLIPSTVDNRFLVPACRPVLTADPRCSGSVCGFPGASFHCQDRKQPFSPAGIDNNADAFNGQAGFRNIGGQHDFATPVFGSGIACLCCCSDISPNSDSTSMLSGMLLSFSSFSTCPISPAPGRKTSIEPLSSATAVRMVRLTSVQIE